MPVRVAALAARQKCNPCRLEAVERAALSVAEANHAARSSQSLGRSRLPLARRASLSHKDPPLQSSPLLIFPPTRMTAGSGESRIFWRCMSGFAVFSDRLTRFGPPEELATPHSTDGHGGTAQHPNMASERVRTGSTHPALFVLLPARRVSTTGTGTRAAGPSHRRNHDRRRRHVRIASAGQHSSRLGAPEVGLYAVDKRHEGTVNETFHDKRASSHNDSVTLLTIPIHTNASQEVKSFLG